MAEKSRAAKAKDSAIVAGQVEADSAEHRDGFRNLPVEDVPEETGGFPDLDSGPNSTMRDAQIPSKFGEFTIFIRPPTYLEVTADTARQLEAVQNARAFPELWENRLELICNWEGVQRSDGAQIPFTLERLQNLCSHDPGVFTQIRNELAKSFRGASSGEEKGDAGGSSPS